MTDSTTSSLNLSTESNQVGAEDGSLTQITFMDPKLYVAAADGDIHVLEQYEIHVQLTPNKNTVLHVAAQFGQVACVKWILQSPSPSSLLQQPNEKGDTPLHLAAREGHLTVVKNLIDAAKQLEEGDAEGGAAADCKEMLRMTNEVKEAALHEAVKYHHPEVVKLLIEEDPEFTYGANAEGNTPLYIAAEWGLGDLVQMILDNCTSPAHSGMKGRTALHAAVILNNDAMTKKILEWKPALTKELDENGWSPLHFAASTGCHPTIVRQLLEKSDRYVVYLGVKDHEIGNRTALHIAASRGHADVVKALVSHFPDCCEKVDDEGNNALHLIMPEKRIFVTSGLLNIRWLRVRGLMNEKNVEGKTPLHLFHNSSLFKDDKSSLLEQMVPTWIFSPLRLRRWMRRSRVSVRTLGSQEIKEDSGSSESEESKEISEIKKIMKTHMIVAALIVTVTFTASFTLPGGYIQDEGNNQGMAVLSVPINGTNDKDRDMAIAAREIFENFVVANSFAMVYSMSAISIYFIATDIEKHKSALKFYLRCGSALISAAMSMMVMAFIEGLQAVLHPSIFPELDYIVGVYLFCVVGPFFISYTFDPTWKMFSKKVKSYTLM